MLLLAVLCLACVAVQSCQQAPQKTYLATVEAVHQALTTAQPGDTLWLANGQWTDAELVVVGNGTAQKPIVVMAQTAGQVQFTGNSNLKIAGEYMVVSGLHFTNGYTPTREVIAFRVNKEQLAYHCRVTQTAIVGYTNPERHDNDLWVGIYGKYNRFDHNALVGKGNRGVTLAVRLNTKESQDNQHQIDHNYFGPRDVLGANGGETLRIGTSHYSLTYSNTAVTNNYFDRCNGEHEIISNKACGNLFQGNTFFECAGTLTFRHGNDNRAVSNAFFGNRAPHTGGIRVINQKQTVSNNYGYGLTGHRFRGAMVIMNGVPNSPINRYHQVKDCQVNNNTFINCDYVQLCAGSDAERSAVPLNTTVNNNLFWNEGKDDVFTVYDDITGISFAGNVLSPNIPAITPSGFSQAAGQLDTLASGLLAVRNLSQRAGIDSTFKAVAKNNTGPAWYVKPQPQPTFDFGSEVPVPEGSNLFEAAKNTRPGDVLTLEAGQYLLTKVIEVHHPLTIKANGNATIKFEKANLFAIENGGALKLVGLTIDGADSPDYAGNAVVRTSRYSMVKNYKLFIDQCRFTNLDVNHTFNVLKVYKNTFADSIVITNSHFNNISGNVLTLDVETDDIGIYNAEFVVLHNNTFTNVGQQVVSLHRGGSDESTFGPLLYMSQCRFDNIGHHTKNKSGLAFSLHGVQKAEVYNSTFSNTKNFDIYHTVGEPITRLGQLTIDRPSLFTISDNTAVQEQIVVGILPNGALPGQQQLTQ